jgi:predicted N-acetyltransferase YhbS
VRVARNAGLEHMTLVAVNGSAPFWLRMGFRQSGDDTIQAATRAKYDADAVHMERLLA